MKAFAFLNGSKKTQQQGLHHDQQTLPQLLVSKSSYEHDEPPFSAPASSSLPSSTRSNGSSSLKARPALSLRLPRRSNERIFSGNHTLPAPDPKSRSPIYTRFGFSKSSSQLPGPPILTVQTAGGSNPTTPTNINPPVPAVPSHFVAQTSPRSVKPQDLPDEESPASFGILRAERAYKKRATVHPNNTSSTVQTIGASPASLGPTDEPATSVLLQRRRAKSMGSSANRSDISALKIPPPLQLPPPMPLPVRLDSASSIHTQDNRPLTSSLLAPMSLTSGSPLSATLSLGPGSTEASATATIAQSESNSSRARSESNSSRARSESNSSATSFYRFGNYSSNLQACDESSATVFSSRPSSIKVRPRNGSGLSSSSGHGVALRLDDVCDSFLKEVKEDLKQDIGPLFMNEKRKKPRSSEPAVKGLPLVPASAPATIVSFCHDPPLTAGTSPPTPEFRILSKAWSVAESESVDSQISSTTQLTPTKKRLYGADGVPRMRVTAPKEDGVSRQCASNSGTAISKTKSMDSISSLPYLRFSMIQHEPTQLRNESDSDPTNGPCIQMSPRVSSLDLALPPAPVRTSSDGEVPLTTPPDERPISTFSIDSVNSQFSNFSLSLFPSPPSVPIIRPTTDKGTFTTDAQCWEGEKLGSTEGENYQEARVLQFRSIVPSRKTNLHNIILLNSIKTPRAPSRAIAPDPTVSRCSSPYKSKSASLAPEDTLLAAPNYEALLKGMEEVKDAGPTSASMHYTPSVAGPREASSSSKLRSLFSSSVGSMSSHGQESIESPESTKSNGDGSRFQWGYAL
ncbi:SubName: Full=Uncharacterized protein {ECO:0000313/EMBL:CCA66599.1} [Serendipita indica DSM 11827]|nr:SubName: Full=Uncharacterized protein {ECO:0000313/EMBL:CCA66599.1} [Serendipita indica DSM 11827]